VFEDVCELGEGFALKGEGGLVFPEYAVDGGRAYPHQLIPDSGGDAEGRPPDDIIHLPAHEGNRELPALIPEEGPDQAQGGDNIIGVDFFAVGGSFFFRRFEFDGRAFHEEDGLRLRRFVEKVRGVLPVFVSGNADEFVQNG
jgi:hypothetical protein